LQLEPITGYLLFLVDAERLEAVFDSGRVCVLTADLGYGGTGAISKHYARLLPRRTRFVTHSHTHTHTGSRDLFQFWETTDGTYLGSGTREISY